MELPKRKAIRLKDFDYSQSGIYFITICIKDKQQLLWENVGANCVRPNGKPVLSDIGNILNNEIQKINSVYENVLVDKYCIMPDHIHMIIFILTNENGRTQFAPTISRIIKQFKGSVTKQLGYLVWQKSFNDRIIRSEKGYAEVCKYIEENPIIID